MHALRVRRCVCLLTANTNHKVRFLTDALLTPMAASSLHLDDYKRYGRQMILDGIGLPGSFVPEVSLIFFIK